MAWRANDLRSYLLEQLLPLWARHGVDSEHGGFLYHLTHDLEPVPAPEKRLRIQARQIYAFSRAVLMGAPDWALETARAGFAFLMSHFRDPRHGGYFLMTTRDGRAPYDTHKEMYEHAFVLLAMAWYHQATGETRAEREADAVWDCLETRLRDHRHGGFFEGATEDWQVRREPRRQNPHMHTLEAVLAWYEHTGDARWLERASELVELFRNRFFDRGNGTLTEHFTAGWQRAPDRRGEIVEPGHHFEWVFLLEEYARLAGEESWGADTRALFDFASRHGVDRALGGAYDEIDRAGRVQRATKRVWPQTEHLKALAAAYRATGAREARAALERALDFCFDRYVIAAHGGWQEQLDAENRVISDTMHATTIYHIVLALSEVAKVLD